MCFKIRPNLQDVGIGMLLASFDLEKQVLIAPQFNVVVNFSPNAKRELAAAELDAKLARNEYGNGYLVTFGHRRRAVVDGEVSQPRDAEHRAAFWACAILPNNRKDLRSVGRMRSEFYLARSPKCSLFRRYKLVVAGWHWRKRGRGMPRA